MQRRVVRSLVTVDKSDRPLNEIKILRAVVQDGAAGSLLVHQ
jgi:hypothetical protein